MKFFFTQHNVLRRYSHSFFFFSGLGDLNGRTSPTLVSAIKSVGSVACGSAQTFAVSQNGMITWAFGSSESGKLGLGMSQGRVCHPQVRKNTRPRSPPSLRQIVGRRRFVRYCRTQNRLRKSIWHRLVLGRKSRAALEVLDL